MMNSSTCECCPACPTPSQAGSRALGDPSASCSSVPAEVCRRRGACVLFTVMDHDWLSTNDFAGEAALGLGSISGILRPQVGGSTRTGQPITLHLRRPRAQGKWGTRGQRG